MGEATHVIWSKECGASIYLLSFAVRLNSSKNIVLKIVINKIERNGLSLRLQIAHKNNVIIMKIMIMKTIIIVFRSSRILDEKLGLVSVLAFFFLHSREVGGEERKKRKRKKNKNLSTVVSRAWSQPADLCGVDSRARKLGSLSYFGPKKIISECQSSDI